MSSPGPSTARRSTSRKATSKLLISPAAVELGGICTTPREQDFEKVTREHIVEMYKEVCVSPEKFAAITARLAPKAGCARLAVGKTAVARQRGLKLALQPGVAWAR